MPDDPGLPDLPDDWSEGDTLHASDFVAHAERINEVENQNADDYTRDFINVNGAVTLPNVARTDYTIFVKDGGAPKLPTSAQNINTYTIVNDSTGPITLTCQASQNIQGAASLVLPPEHSVDLRSNGTGWRIV